MADKSNTAHLKIGPMGLATMLEQSTLLNEPVLIVGPPGVGKSQVVAQVARKLYGDQNGQFLIDFRAATHDPVDLHGVPAVDSRDNGDVRTMWTIPEFLPTEMDIEAGIYAENGILFLDEIGQAPPSMQGALFGLVLDRGIGKYRLPPGWSVVAATNRQEDRAGAYRILSALADRFTSVELTVDQDQWIRWAINTALDPRVIAFIRNTAGKLHDFDVDQMAFPTPRGWERVGRKWLAACGDKKATTVAKDGWLRPAVAGTVGQGATTEFFAYLTTYEHLPDIEDVWRDPLNAIIPDSTSARYMVATTLAVRVQPKQMTAFAEYLLRMPKEIGAMAIKDIGAREDKDDLRKTAGFGKLAVAFGSIKIGA